MNLVKYFLFLFPVFVFSQTSVTAELIVKQELNVDQLVEIDNFGTQYFIQQNTFYKKNKSSRLNYSNVQLGNLTFTNAFNPLKINLFYSEFNTAIILDNRLAEITKIDFNTLKPFRSVSHISTANDNAIWLFNQNTQQLELFDYLTKKTKLTSLPVASNVLDLKSNYNFCWMLTENYLYVYHYTGSLISKLTNSGFVSLEESNGNLFLLKNNELNIKLKNSNEIRPIELPELLINQFLVTNETLYIYNDGILHQYRLKTD